MNNLITDDMDVVYFVVQVNGVPVSTRFSERMMAEMAKSNLPEMENGRTIYNLFVKPAMTASGRLARATYLLYSLKPSPARRPVQGIPVPRSTNR